ncbi:4-alpha-glucanotransferase, partial [Georgenia sp. 10Sc9-8]|nr:4-alpha-glucanotransferase [Georgenia halotolerans]
MTDEPQQVRPDLPSEDLRALAEAHGVATEFSGFTGEHRQVPAGTIRTVLAALGVAAADEDEVRASLADLEVAPWREVLPPSVVVRAGREHPVPVHVPDGAAVRAHVELEDGRRRTLAQSGAWVAPRLVDGRLTGRATFLLPADLPLGWHRVVAEVEGAEPVDTTLAVAPDRLPDPSLRTARGWGMMAQLYSVRSAGSWGVGDLADLAELTSFLGDAGADFLLINPLHAAEAVGHMT